jgi:hypothetical protein
MVSLKLAPSMATLLSVIADRTKATNTPRMVSVWLRRRPIQLPPKSRAEDAGQHGAHQRRQWHCQQG